MQSIVRGRPSEISSQNHWGVHQCHLRFSRLPGGRPPPRVVPHRSPPGFATNGTAVGSVPIGA